jgi:ArsR family transcriptional regulator
VAKALADPQRFAILRHICTHCAGAEVGCKTIVAAFGVSQATISHHLKELQAAGLIEGRREGQCLMLTPRPERLRAYLTHLEQSLLA